MNNDKMRHDFLQIVMGNKNYSDALELVKKHGADFTMYSCTDETINLVLGSSQEDLPEIIERIKKANLEEIYIHDIVVRRKNKVDPLDMFFKSFESLETKERLFVLLGETGVGKSYIVEKRYPMIPQYACNKLLDPYTLCYYTDDKDKNGSLSNYETPFLKALKRGGQVFLDEMNELPHETLMFIQGITDEKKSVVIGDEVITISPTFRILAAMNPPSETDERTPLGDAILGRSVGHVLRLTDDIICERLGKSQKWLSAVRKFHNYVSQSGMIDVRPLDFRWLQKFVKYDFESQFEYLVSMGDVINIRNYEKLTLTGEYDKLLQEVYNA